MINITTKVYKAVNKLNGAFYIGLTKEPLEVRKWQHGRAAKPNAKPKFLCAINEYGIENFDFHQLYEFDNRSDAGEMERLLISELNPHYNMAPGGGYGYGYWLGKSRSEETKKKISRTKRERGSPRPTEKSLHALKNSAREKSRKIISKPVICINDGKAYQSCAAADATYGLAPKAVSQVASGKRNSVHGLRFKYVN